MKIENLLNNNKDNSPKKTKLPALPEGKTNLEILDNYKNMQKVWSETLQTQHPQVVPPMAPPANDDIQKVYDYFPPGTSKLKKILMTSKSPEPINLTNYRRNSVEILESPGALVGGDTDKNFESSQCDSIGSANLNRNSNSQQTPDKNSLPGNVSLSSLSGNSSFAPDQSPENQILNKSAPNLSQDNSSFEHQKPNEIVTTENVNLNKSRELFPDIYRNPLPGSLSSKNPQLSGILSASPKKSSSTGPVSAHSPNITALLSNTTSSSPSKLPSVPLKKTDDLENR